MPQPLPILKRKIQIHLTINKNINKHRKKKQEKNCLPNFFFREIENCFNFNVCFYEIITLFYFDVHIRRKKRQKKLCVKLSSSDFIMKIYNKKKVCFNFSKNIYIFHKQLTLEQKFIRRPFYTFWPQYPWHHQPPIIKFLFLRFLFCLFYHTFSFFSWFSLSHFIKAFYFHLDYRLTIDLYLF